MNGPSLPWATESSATKRSSRKGIYDLSYGIYPLLDLSIMYTYWRYGGRCACGAQHVKLRLSADRRSPMRRSLYVQYSGGWYKYRHMNHNFQKAAAQKGQMSSNPQNETR